MNVLGDRVTLKTGSEASLGAWEMFEIETPPGGGTQKNRHPWDEGYFVLAGNPAFDLADRAVSAGPGAFVHVPAGSAHAVQNRGEVPVLGAAPARVQSFFGDLEKAAQQAAPSIETIVGIAAKHGIELA